jgi:small subunit ribosomal protein S2
MEQLEREKASGELEKYTKKERMNKEEELVRLGRLFDGLRALKRLPEVVFIVDTIQDDTAVREARRVKIPTVALCDTNANADLIDYPIPSNDDALPAVRYMVGRIGAAIEEGQRQREEMPNDKIPMSNQ